MTVQVKKVFTKKMQLLIQQHKDKNQEVLPAQKHMYDVLPYINVKHGL